MERKILDLTLRNEMGIERIGEKNNKIDNILTAINTREWLQIGHMYLKEDNRWKKRLIEWQPRDGKINRDMLEKQWII